MELKPLNNKIILEPVSAEETTKSGLIIPDTVNRKNRNRAR
jgi:co-chaperonin GroES (HSP10)